jgi:hypothetical protein
MTPELQKYYEERFSMMGTTGWRELMEDVDTMINSLNNLAVIERVRPSVQEGRIVNSQLAEVA